MWNKGPLAAETLKIIEDRVYTASDGRQVDVKEALESAIMNTAILVADQLALVVASYTEHPPLNFDETIIRVVNDTAQSALLEAVWGGSTTPFVLNFASAKTPGGGFLRDAKAQEEDLCRASGLFACIKSQYPFYAAYHLNPSPLNTDHMILSAEVPFWKFDDYMPPVPVMAVVVTMAAPNLSGYDKASFDQLFTRAEEALHRRIRSVLAVAAANGCDSLVLGAWGCGVFKNDPEMVATLFRHHLLSAAFEHAFREVIFAVWDTEEGTPLFNTFKRILEPEEP